MCFRGCEIKKLEFATSKLNYLKIFMNNLKIIQIQISTRNVAFILLKSLKHPDLVQNTMKLNGTNSTPDMGCLLLGTKQNIQICVTYQYHKIIE